MNCLHHHPLLENDRLCASPRRRREFRDLEQGRGALSCLWARRRGVWRRFGPRSPPAIAPPAAVLNAVNDALRSIGACVSETPITPERVLTAIVSASAS